MINKRHLSILDEIKKSGGEIDSGKPNDSVLLIDGMNTFIRVFSAIPTTNEDGVHVGGIVGFLRSLAFSINMIRPTRTIVVFDGKGGSNRRRKIFPQYKMGRKMSYRLNRANNYLSDKTVAGIQGSRHWSPQVDIPQSKYDIARFEGNLTNFINVRQSINSSDKFNIVRVPRSIRTDGFLIFFHRQLGGWIVPGKGEPNDS